MQIAFTSFKISKDPSGETRLQRSMSGKRTLQKTTSHAHDKKMSMIPSQKTFSLQFIKEQTVELGGSFVRQVNLVRSSFAAE